jgi:hypothetical protein
MSKHYNLTVTDDNGKSVTTSNTSTEHPEEVLRMMQLAGMQSEPQCGMESVEENEYQPTPKNDKLDLDDYSKKSPESISKQPKKLQPSRGDNPLEYSLDENEIYESLMAEIEAVEEGKVNPGLQAYLDKKKGKKDDKDDKEKEKADESVNEAKCDCDCGQDPCEECGKSHHKLKEAEPMGDYTDKEFACINIDTGEYGYCDKDELHKYTHYVPAEEFTYFDDTSGMNFADFDDEMADQEGWTKIASNESAPMGEYTDKEFACININTGEYGYCDKDELHKYTHMVPAKEFTYFDDENEDMDFADFDDEMADQEGWTKIKSVKEESPELARLRKLAGTEQIDELLPAVGAVAGAVGRALISKGIKGTASRAAATTVASKALNKNNTPQ